MDTVYESKTILTKKQIRWKKRYEAKMKRASIYALRLERIKTVCHVLWVILKAILITLSVVALSVIALLVLRQIVYLAVGVVAAVILLLFLN